MRYVTYNYSFFSITAGKSVKSLTFYVRHYWWISFLILLEKSYYSECSQSSKVFHDETTLTWDYNQLHLNHWHFMNRLFYAWFFKQFNFCVLSCSLKCCRSCLTFTIFLVTSVFFIINVALNLHMFCWLEFLVTHAILLLNYFIFKCIC